MEQNFTLRPCATDFSVVAILARRDQGAVAAAAAAVQATVQRPADVDEMQSSTPSPTDDEHVERFRDSYHKHHHHRRRHHQNVAAAAAGSANSADDDEGENTRIFPRFYMVEGWGVHLITPRETEI